MLISVKNVYVYLMGDTMKKILYVTTISTTMNVFLIPHITMLIKKGNEVHIACNIDQEISKELLEIGVKFHKIDFSRNPIKRSNINAYNQLKKLYDEENYDIVNTHTPVASFITRFALRKKKIKMIYTCHGFHFYKGAPLLNWILYYPIESLAARWTDIIVTINSEDMKRAEKFKIRKNGQVRLMHGVGIDPKKYKLSNFDFSKYRNEIGINDDDFVVLMLAELNKNKNHIQIIKAMKMLKDRYPKIKVVIAGNGPLRTSLEEYVNTLKLGNNIKFLGFRSDVKELLNISDCVMLLSKREGLGKCMLEGMIAGKPLIATNTRGPRELISNNKNGYLVKVGDYKNTAYYIENIYLDKVKRDRFAKYSLRKINKYHLNNVLKEVNEYC